MPQTKTGEIRQDLLTNAWVIYAPRRARRPNEMEQPVSEADRLPEKDRTCPFCIGNEKMIPPVTSERVADDGNGWVTRVVPNKYPVLEPDIDVAGTNRDIYRVTTSHGRHDVVVETPFHNRDIPLMEREEVESIIETYAARYGALYAADATIETIIIFRNHGWRAGTSLRHPHSQIIATSFVPQSVAHREKTAAEYHHRTNRCVLCDVVEQERAEGTRLVSENASFVSFVPFAAAAPCEIWIVPKQHCGDFGLIAQQERIHLAVALQDALQRLHDKLDDPDYNYVIHSGPRQDALVPHLHWYLQIRPRLTMPAGFEIGSGMEINHSLPEDAAEFLRGP